MKFSTRFTRNESILRIHATGTFEYLVYVVSIELYTERFFLYFSAGKLWRSAGLFKLAATIVLDMCILSNSHHVHSRLR